jgi:hypothetical protein
MSLWHEHALADAHHADLRRQAEHRRLATASGPAGTGRRRALASRLEQRLGMLLVETGLHLITRTGSQGRLKLWHSAASSNTHRLHP